MNSELLNVVTLGDLLIANPAPGEPSFLSAASGAVWTQRSGRFYAVGDDQGSVGEFLLRWADVQKALRLGDNSAVVKPGVAQRILPGVLPQDESARKEAKADFEAMTIIRRRHIEALDGQIRKDALRRFPHGLLLIAGSGGMSWGGTRRSLCVIYSMDEKGHISGLPAKISLEGLHEFLEDNVRGELNIEGICVHGPHIILAQRGNSFDDTNQPAPNVLIRLSLAYVLQSMYTDLMVSQCELEDVTEYDLGHATLEKDGRSYEVKLDFTDIDSVEDDDRNRLVFTAAAEATGEAAIDGVIAGSVVGVIDAEGRIENIYPLADRTIKLEGINGLYNESTGSIDLLLVSDADNPAVPAPLMAARIPG